MSAAYGKLEGNRGEVTRTGTCSSGVTSKLNTWLMQVVTHLMPAKDNKHCDYITIDINGYECVRVEPIIICLTGLQRAESGDKLFINGKEYTCDHI